ncbi:hypothetical protein [Geoalkalibacter halelectricus]|uniref:hypothetical protein n=1 Tax=Geoalkalibacter halelectricus TaxID=2847045 RepID=UPI00266F9545|nr:hypothetical protein [Geoalkalibacter halelectricus]MDO3380392.1 hypothetical protein [Geoalkalibacter halelectricus]
MLDSHYIKRFLKDATETELRNMATLCRDELSLRHKRQGAINRISLAPGDKATTTNLRNTPDGTVVKIQSIKRTRAVAVFPDGTYSVPLDCLIPVKTPNHNQRS